MGKIINRILNCDISKNTETDWNTTNAANAGIITRATPPKKSVDLREDWWKIANQKKTGSCVGWSIADGALRWHLVKIGKLTKTEKLSVRYIWMASKETDEFISRPSTFLEIEGTSIKAGLDICRKYGIVKERVLPFGSAKFYSGDSGDFYAMASQFKLMSYFNLGIDFDAWKLWLSEHGPITARLICDKNWNTLKKPGILNNYDIGSARGGHAVLVVGYNRDYFILRNSWGTTWGDGGFAYATPLYMKEAFTEAYGLTV